MPDLPRILAFKSSEFQMHWPDDASGGTADQAEPWGLDLAERISARLSEFDFEAERPLEATEGWEVDVATPDARFSVFVHWAPFGDRGEDHWVCQVFQRKNLLGRLLGRTNVPLIERLCESLETVVREFEDTSDLRWLSMEEFRELY
ncbi:MAG: hypothetical protein SX243_26165 [Acidobacteriota bacterium]|nr:hypothetical protein [Acidobacteriota bacterium]